MQGLAGAIECGMYRRVCVVGVRVIVLARTPRIEFEVVSASLVSTRDKLSHYCQPHLESSVHEVPATLSYSQHRVLNEVIDIDGDVATASWYLDCPAVFRPGNVRKLEGSALLLGRYLFEEECLDAGLACHQFATGPVGHYVVGEMGRQRSPGRCVAGHQAIDTIAVD